MTSHEDNSNGRQQQWKTTFTEDDLNKTCRIIIALLSPKFGADSLKINALKKMKIENTKSLVERSVLSTCLMLFAQQFQFKLPGLITWEHLPPVAVFQSVHKTADLGSFMDAFLVWIELRTSAVLWTDPITADLSSSIDTFRSLIFFPHRTAYLSSFMDTFRTLQSNFHKTAYLSSSMDTFRSLQKMPIKLRTLAVLWTIF